MNESFNVTREIAHCIHLKLVLRLSVTINGRFYCAVAPVSPIGGLDAAQQQAEDALMDHLREEIFG